jgi:hypothetical protein
MKRSLFIIFLAFIVCSLHAQTYFYGRPVRLGFKLDPVFANSLKPFDNGVEKNGSGFGINYGLMADIAFRETRGAFATGIEVVHAPSKLLYTENGLYGSGEYKLKLQYLQVPLSIKLKTNEMKGIHWWGQFGTYVGALIGARADFIKGANNTTTNSSVSNARILDKTNKVNLGLLIGAGGEYNLGGKTDLYFGLGFENGFTDITTNKHWNDGKVTLNRWALRLGMFF